MSTALNIARGAEQRSTNGVKKEMICRQCPGCGVRWYSSVTETWMCEDCGARMDDRHEKPLGKRVKEIIDGRKKRDVSNKLCGQ